MLNRPFTSRTKQFVHGCNQVLHMFKRGFNRNDFDAEPLRIGFF